MQRPSRLPEALPVKLPGIRGGRCTPAARRLRTLGEKNEQHADGEAGRQRHLRLANFLEGPSGGE